MSDHALGFRVGLRSLERECPGPTPLAVEGVLPRELAGTLYRVGPARWDIHGERLRHWFDGDGMVHSFTLADGRVSYRSRFVQHTAHVEEDRAQRRLYGGFGTTAPGSRLRRLLRRKRRRNPANTHIVPHAGGLYALCEGGRPWRLDPRDLVTLGEETLGGLLPTPISTFTAHPKRDPDTGDLWGFGLEPGRVPKLHLYRWPAAAPATRVATVALPMPAMIHDFGLTPTVAVVVATPMVTPDLPLALMFGQSSYGENLHYKPERGAHVGLIDRTTGAAVWYPTDPFLAFHVVNAWDEADAVVVDLCAYQGGELLHVFYEMMAGPVRTIHGQLLRLRVDRRTRRVTREVLHPGSFELPRTTGAAGRPHTHVFGLTWGGSHTILGRPAVFDLATRTLHEAPTPEHAWAGELVPVAKPGATSEADAWLLTVVLDSVAATSELHVLDARDLAAGPVARARLPHIMPLGFHGSWLPTA